MNVKRLRWALMMAGIEIGEFHRVRMRIALARGIESVARLLLASKAPHQWAVVCYRVGMLIRRTVH